MALCFFGDGGLHQGILYECMDMAGLWKLPVIYLCEYNRFAEFTHSDTTFPTQDLALRAAPHGFPGVEVDGNDVLAVYRATRNAVDRARQGQGPTLIVARTYRIEGHYVGDPLTYRSKEEVEPWRAKEKDPIARFQTLLESEGIMNESLRQGLEAEVDKQIKEAVEFALASPEPEFDSITTDVYEPKGVQ